MPWKVRFMPSSLGRPADSVFFWGWQPRFMKGSWSLSSLRGRGLGPLSWESVCCSAFCLATALITQLTFIELSRLRSAQGTREIRAGLARHTVQLWLAHLLVFGFLVVILLTLEKLPPWLVSSDGLGWREAFVAPLIVLRQIATVAFWPLWSLLLLLGPIAVIEECSFLDAIQQWWGAVAASRGQAAALRNHGDPAGALGVRALFFCPCS